MLATHQDRWTFAHRLNPDGSLESICPVCFESVGRHEKEEGSPARRTFPCVRSLQPR
jgi:hypothetical protein